MRKALPLHIIFRTDASIEIGAGHVMRCLTLAAALREQDAICVFVCRQHKGNMIEYIEEQGFVVLTLSEPKNPMPDDKDRTQSDTPSHADWLGVAWQQDADECIKALSEHFGEHIVDWLIVDHYSLDARWEAKLRPACTQMMVIDDLADRAHDCDLLLDQNLGRTSKDYAGLIPTNATTLLGPRYALLRPEFANLRPESLARRAKAMTLERILVTMGGIDKDNATIHVLDALDASTLNDDVEITVVMGAQAPWLKSVRERAGRMRLPTEVLVGVNDMARLMTDSDLAIGAAGSTTWERCCLGLPAIQVTLAKNQQEINQATSYANATIYSDILDIENVLTNFVEDTAPPTRLLEMMQAAADITDGGGIEMASHLLLENRA